MNTLVLGSSGQIGTFLRRHLRKAGHRVEEYDIANYPHQDLRIPPGEPDQMIAQQIEDADFVFFLAFDVGGSRYLAKYQHTFDFMQNNIRIMSNTFACLRHSKTPFIFATSQMSNMSYSPYGVAKAVGECYTRSLGGLIVKFWNVYGVEHDLEKAHVITDFILKAKNTGVIDMMTDGQEERDFLYAADCCEALEMLMHRYHDIPRSEDLCVTSFNWTKIIDVAKNIAARFGATVVPAEKKDAVQLNAKNKPSEYILSLWQPKTTIYEGISKVIDGM